MKFIFRGTCNYSAPIASGGKSTQFSYLNSSKDILIENDWSKNESHPVKYSLSKSLKVFGFKYALVSTVKVEILSRYLY